MEILQIKDLIAYNMNNRDPRLPLLCNKISVKQYAADRGVKSAKVLMVSPEQYVRKTTAASGDSQVKTPTLRLNYGANKGEWWYSQTSNVEFYEEFVPQDLVYQFHVHEGKILAIQSRNSKEAHKDLETTYDTEGNLLPLMNPKNTLTDYPYPDGDLMEAAKVLAEDLYYVRVDLFKYNEEIYLSEMTFAPMGGRIDYTFKR